MRPQRARVIVRADRSSMSVLSPVVETKGSPLPFGRDRVSGGFTLLGLRFCRPRPTVLGGRKSTGHLASITRKYRNTLAKSDIRKEPLDRHLPQPHRLPMLPKLADWNSSPLRRYARPLLRPLLKRKGLQSEKLWARSALESAFPRRTVVKGGKPVPAYRLRAERPARRLSVGRSTEGSILRRSDSGMDEANTQFGEPPLPVPAECQPSLEDACGEVDASEVDGAGANSTPSGAKTGRVGTG